MISIQPNLANTNDTQRLMSIYIIYRTCLGLMLGAAHWSGLAQDIFGARHPEVFSNTAMIYIAVCIVSLVRFKAIPNSTSRPHLLILLIIDIIALITMIYASGNFVGGLGYLLLIPMAIGSTFLGQRENIALAAFGTILVLGLGFFNLQDGTADNRTLFSAGVTGVLLFVTAIAFNLFSEKVQTSQLTTRKVTEQANYLKSLNEWVVETLQTGVIVIDNALNIQLTNQAAKELLQDDNLQALEQFNDLNPLLTQWREDGVIPSPTTISVANNNIRISFKPLQTHQRPSIILFLDDANRLKQQAQQLKLASLGRLTANIAHEIRNPLNTISHAGQLLYESDFANTDDKQLLDMVNNNSQRIDDIIKSIITFSRSQFAQPQVININKWLHSFRDDFLRLHVAEINLFEEAEEDFIVNIDATHLYQIISNIVNNGLRYSEALTGSNRVCLYISQSHVDYVHIDIVDFGKGIEEDHLDKIFEPFFTTEGTGSGLGLYLCKELCIANHSELSYFTNNPYNLSTFRLTIPAHTSSNIE